MRLHSQFSINLDNLETNISLLKKLAPNSDILFMVKADGYGHGAPNIVRHAFKCGVSNFGLATVHEAMALRRLSRDQTELYVFSDLQLADGQVAESYQTMRLLPVIGSLAELDMFLTMPEMKSVPLVLKVNIGMNRLGISMQEWESAVDFIKRAGRRSIFHFMGHLSNSANSMVHDLLNISQMATFKKAKSFFRDHGLDIERSSVANSGAIEQGSGLDENFVRPGLMLYGPSALNANVSGRWTGKMVGKLTAQILHLFPVRPGMNIGYGGTIIQKEGYIALLSLGYGDGLPTRLSGVKTDVSGIAGEFFGRVNMDMAQFYFASSDLGKMKLGEVVHLWGDDSAQFLSLCRQANMIPYELFCQITSRVPRTYHSKFQQQG